MLKKYLTLSLDKGQKKAPNPVQFYHSTEILPLKPEKVLEKYTQEELDACWEALCISIIQNYQRGKGTFIKGFGTFTYKNPELNLEGTTNEMIRDKKLRYPIFIVSKEFNPNVRPGEFNPVSGIRYFITKENKNINIINLNYSEIAFSLSMPKDKVSNIIKCLITYINESIVNKTFKNKQMGLLGNLILNTKLNILAVKFDENFEKSILGKNKLLNNIKPIISLRKDLENSKNLTISNFPDLYKTYESLKAKNSLITEFSSNAKRYLNKNYKINIEDSNSINNRANSLTQTMNQIRNNKNKLYSSYDANKFFTQSPNHPFKFLNDANINNDINKNLSMTKKNKKIEDEKVKNPLGKLDNNVLKNMSFLKGSMIKEAKDLDINKRGSITKEKAIYILMKNIPQLKRDLAEEIIEFYFNTDQIDYMKLITLLIQGSKNSFLKKKGYFDFAKFLFKKKGLVFPVNTKFNFKDFIVRQKKKKLSVIQIADEELQKLKELRAIEREKQLSGENKPLFYEEQKFIEKNVKELNILYNLIPNLKEKFSISLDQKINIKELLNILKDNFGLFYQKEEMEELLRYIELKNTQNFSLMELIDRIKLWKLINKNYIDLSEFNKVFKKINDAIYMNGGEKFLFENRNTLDVNTFIKLLKDKNSLDEHSLKSAFYFIVKTSREMTRDDYNKFFGKKSMIDYYDEPYFINMMKKIILTINAKYMTPVEYFDRLLSYNKSTKNKLISRSDWIKYLQREKFDFNAEELDNFFNWIDTKKDNAIDFEEFEEKLTYTLKPLTTIKTIIHNNKLDIEDLAHKMGISADEVKKIEYPQFFKSLKKLDYTLPEVYIQNIFDELKQTEEKPNLSEKSKLWQTEYVSSKKFLDEINYAKSSDKHKIFSKNYIDIVRSKTTYEELKIIFEIFDQGSSGVMTKIEYAKSMSKLFPEFNDEDHMRFVRINDLFDKSNKVIYPELLNIIFYENMNKKNDHFTIICEFLLGKLKNQCQNDVERLMYLIEDNPKARITSLRQHEPLTFEQLEKFLKKNKLTLDKKVIQKLDIDSDGLISYNDLYAILLRYRDTLYFKYYNNSNDANINLFTKDSLSNEKIGIIAQKLLTYMKNINITPYGLFKKFDKDNNGLISNIDFNQGLKKYLDIDAALADPFFAYLDFYNVGMVDFETFMTRLNYINEDVLKENDRKIENKIIVQIKEFILKNKHLSDNEIFQIMDKDFDGIINQEDLISFSKENLNVPENMLGKDKIERVMMTLSLTKNLQVGFNDISEFIKLSRANKQVLPLKEVFHLTSNQNLSQNKKNVDWINDIIERLGLYVSEKYESIEEFFY